MRRTLLLFIFAGIYCLSFAQSSTPKLAIDHIIIWTEKDAPEIKLLEEKEFTIHPEVSVHIGMGTGGRYVNFFNVYLEFLYLDEKATIDPKIIYFPHGRRDKMREKKKSPFGLGLYMTPYDTTRIPFKTIATQAPWMRPNTSLHVAESNLSYEQEPIIFIVPPYMELPKFDSLEDIEKKVSDPVIKKRVMQPLVHVNGVRKLTNVKVVCTAKRFSATVKALKDIENLQVVKGKEHLLDLTFDDNKQNKTIDFRPKLPVIIKL